MKRDLRGKLSEKYEAVRVISKPRVSRGFIDYVLFSRHNLVNIRLMRGEANLDLAMLLSHQKQAQPQDSQRYST